jgi:hypothetical protein
MDSTFCDLIDDAGEKLKLAVAAVVAARDYAHKQGGNPEISEGARAMARLARQSLTVAETQSRAAWMAVVQ